MHINKYLCDADKPSFPPGPFSARLKYELRQQFFERKIQYSLHFVYATAIVCLVILCSILVVNPQTAQRLNTFVMGTQETQAERLLLADKGIDISTFQTGIKTVSTDVSNSFPFIERDKQYVVSRISHNDKELIYISEVKRPQAQRRSY